MKTILIIFCFCFTGEYAFALNESCKVEVDIVCSPHPTEGMSTKECDNYRAKNLQVIKRLLLKNNYIPVPSGTTANYSLLFGYFNGSSNVPNVSSQLHEHGQYVINLEREISPIPFFGSWTLGLATKWVHRNLEQQIEKCPYE